jgi:DNA invertase Pin-like site-specific DNA recombinase
MAEGRFISYLRVSTSQQGRSGLGLEAQRQAVADYLNGGRWELLTEFVEVESGKRADRPRLEAAMAACRLHRATLVIAKLDRLARNVAFVSRLMESGVEFIVADMPKVNRLTIHILAAVAEAEADLISARTKAALAAAKARGKVLGGTRPGAAERGQQVAALGRAALQAKAAARDADLQPVLRELAAAGITTQAGIARALTARGIETARKGRWSNVQVGALQRRLDAGAPRG